MLEGMMHRSKNRIGSWSVGKKTAVLILAGLAVYGTTIVLDQFVFTQAFAGGAIHADIGVYRARTSTILDGGLLYTDVPTETPPLINYLLVPAQLLGGGDHVWVYSAYFSFFGILDGLLLYWGLKRYDDRLAFLAGLLFILSPYGFIEGGTGEDETIVAFTVLLPALLMLRGKDRLAPIVTALGIWTKMWSILLVPVQFLRAAGWREKAKVVAAVGLISAAVALPFLILCGSDFTWFLQYYFIGNSARNAEGFSAFRFLEEGGFGLPAEMELAIVLVGLAAAYLYAYRKNMRAWESLTLVTAVFFALYPKMHTGYYLVPLLFLVVWAAEDARIAARLYVMYGLTIMAVAFSPVADASSFFQFPGSWAFGLFFSVASSAMLAETAYRALKKRPFTSRRSEESGERGPEEAPSPGDSSAA